MGPTIRAASLRGFVPLVEELGGDPADLLARFGLSSEVLASDSALVPITAHDLMLDAAAAELGCPDLGLRLATVQDLGVLGPLALAIQASATAAEALGCAARFMFVHSPALRIGIQPDPYGRREVVALTYGKDLLESSYSPQATELGLGLFFRFTELLVERRRSVRSVELPHHPLSPVRRYLDFFGADVKFGRPTAALRVERSALDAPFADGNEAVRRLAVEYLTTNFPDPGSQVAPRVRRILAAALGGSPTITHVARLLSVHPRTLQRRLAAEDVRFDALLDDVRRAAAHRLITTTMLPFGQVAGLVGFTEQSTLSHAARRWFGVGPRELRRTAPGLVSS